MTHNDDESKSNPAGKRSLPGGWAAAVLGDLIKIRSGYAFKSADYSSSGIPLLRQSNLGNGVVDLEGAKLLPRKFISQYAGFLIRPGDMLIGLSGSIGKISVFKYDALALQNQRTGLIECCDDAVKNFVRWFYEILAAKLDEKSKGVGVQNISPEDIEALSIPVPPHAEMKRISSKIDELFSRIEAGEHAFERIQKLIERYRQSVLKAAVTGELTREWRERQMSKFESGQELLNRFLRTRRETWEKAELDKMKAKGVKPASDNWKQRYQDPVPPDTTDRPDLPEGWAWASLAQISWASSYGTSQKCNYEPSGPPVLRIPNIRAGRFDYQDIKHSSADLELEQSELLKVGDLLVVRTNGSESLIGVGSVLLTEPPFPCYFASYLIRFRLVAADGLGEWLNLCWQSQVVRRFIHERKASSAGQYNVSQSSLMELCLPIPPALERIQINDQVARTISRCDKTMESIVGQGKLAAALRRGVLKSAFTGMLVAQDPSDEPASVLLDRIAAANRTESNPSPKRGRNKRRAA